MEKNTHISLSIIVPVYNTEQYLKRCLDSLINQTLKDIEIICINDCSKDNSLNILKEYKEKDDRIKIIDHEVNKGVSVARNDGIELATGEYIGFVDSDDYVDLDYFELLYKKAKEEDSDVCKASYGMFKKLNKNKLQIIDLTKGINQYHWFYSDIYKTSFLKENGIKFPVGIKVSEDGCFKLESILKANKIAILNKKTYYHYILRENSATTNVIKDAESKCNGVLQSVVIRLALLNSYGYKMDKESYDDYVDHLYETILFYVCEYKAYNNNDLLINTYKTIEYFREQYNIYTSLTNKYVFNKLFEINSLNDLKNILTPEYKTYYLFNRIKLLEITKNVYGLNCRLFGIIELFKTKYKGCKKYYKIFGVPFLCIKIKNRA